MAHSYGELLQRLVFDRIHESVRLRKRKGLILGWGAETDGRGTECLNLLTHNWESISGDRVLSESGQGKDTEILGQVRGQVAGL